jgi:4-hydroxybenzoate polyprenyltransferase
VPPDILGGYFVTTINNVSLINYHDLLLLIISSIFLYCGGLITNDLFDINRDRIERPNRPISSRKIKKSIAVLLAIISFGFGVLLSFFLNITSTIISIFLVIMILSYNYRLKNGMLRPYLMGGIRTLNIVYGTSSNINFLDFLGVTHPHATIQMYGSLVNLVIFTLAVFIHIFTLTFLSARETREEFENSDKKRLNLKKVYAYYLITFIIILYLGLSYLPNKTYFAIFFGLFLLCVNLLFFRIMRKRKLGFADIQILVKNMIILLILLDSSFVAGSIAIYFGFLSLSMVIPCIFIGNKVKMT